MKILMMYKRTMNSQFLAIDIMMNIQTYLYFYFDSIFRINI